MNENLKIALSFVAGLAVGGAVGYYVTKRTMYAKMDAIIEEEVSSVKKALAKKPVRDKDYVSPTEFYDYQEKTAEYSSEDTPEENTDAHAAVHTNIFQSESIRKAGEIDEVNKSIFEREQEARMRKLMDKRTNSDRVPYVITEEEFRTDTPDYERLVLTYYTDDEVLTDDADEDIPQIHTVIGPDAVSNFGVGTEDPSYVYVRSDHEEKCFEIHRVEGSYTEIVLGLEPFEQRGGNG